MSDFKDLFSVQAKDYAKYRPTYPPELFQYLSSLSPSHNLVWDVGTGNGQAAVELAKLFTQVYATDPSEKQITEAIEVKNITYKIESAESPTLETHSANLITVAQAFHWFKHQQFAEVCNKVAAPGCHLAVWTYAVSTVTPSVDHALQKLYQGLLGPYWEKERQLVEEGYRSIKMPFTEVTTPKFELTAEWSLEQFLGYLKTWSALQTYLKKNDSSAINEAFKEISKAWGTDQIRKVTWPLGLRVWKIL